MHPAFTQAITAACNTGNWAHKAQCGWNQPTTAAANAGRTVGPWIVLGLLVLLFFWLGSKAKGRSGKIIPAKS